MGLQQLGFNFFDEEPANESAATPKVVPAANKLHTQQPIDIGAEDTSEQSTSLVVEEEVRDIAFLVEEQPAVSLISVVSANATQHPAKKNTRGRMKLSEMDQVVDLVEVPEDEVLFQKRYYNIGLVSEMFKVNVSLIRFWENEFDILKPKKNGKGDRLFRPEDIKNLQLIYHLLREKKYTIEGAKDFLKKNKKNSETFAVIESLKKTKAFLLELKANL